MQTLKDLSARDSAARAAARAQWQRWTGTYVGEAILEGVAVSSGGDAPVVPRARLAASGPERTPEAAVAAFLKDFGGERATSVLLEYVGKKTGASGEVKASIVMLLHRCWQQFEALVADKGRLKLFAVFTRASEDEEARTACCQLLLHMTNSPRNATCKLLLAEGAAPVLLKLVGAMLEGPAMRAYAARLLAHLVRRSPDAAGQVLEDASAVWRLLGVYTDGLVAASEALGLVSTLLATGAKARNQVAAQINAAAFPLVDLMRHVLDTYCSAPPVVALSFASNDPGGKTSVFLDDPLSLVAIEAAKVVRTLARQPANRATLVSSGGADVLLQLMGAKGVHADVAHQVASSAIGFLASGRGKQRDAEEVWSSYTSTLARSALDDYTTVTSLAQQARSSAGRLTLLRRRTKFLCKHVLSQDSAHQSSKRTAARLLWGLAAQARPSNDLGVLEEEVAASAPPPPSAAALALRSGADAGAGPQRPAGAPPSPRPPPPEATKRSSILAATAGLDALTARLNRLANGDNPDDAGDASTAGTGAGAGAGAGGGAGDSRRGGGAARPVPPPPVPLGDEHDDDGALQHDAVALMFETGSHELAASVGNDVPYRVLRDMGAFSLKSTLLMEDDVVVFTAAAVAAEALCVSAAALDKAQELEATVERKRRQGAAEAAPARTKDGGVALANPMMMAQQASKDARVAEEARELLAARYSLPADEVKQARRFIKAAVLVLQASQRRRATAAAQFNEDIHEAKAAFHAQQRQLAREAREAAARASGDASDAGAAGDSEGVPGDTKDAPRSPVMPAAGGLASTPGTRPGLSPLLAAVSGLPSSARLLATLGSGTGAGFGSPSSPMGFSQRTFGDRGRGAASTVASHATSVASFVSSVRSASTSLETQAVTARLERMHKSRALGVHWNRFLLSRLLAFVQSPLSEVVALGCVGLQDALELDSAGSSSATTLRTSRARRFLVDRGVQWALRAAHARVTEARPLRLVPRPGRHDSADAGGGGGGMSSGLTPSPSPGPSPSPRASLEAAAGITQALAPVVAAARDAIPDAETEWPVLLVNRAVLLVGLGDGDADGSGEGRAGHGAVLSAGGPLSGGGGAGGGASAEDGAGAGGKRKKKAKKKKRKKASTVETSNPLLAKAGRTAGAKV